MLGDSGQGRSARLRLGIGAAVVLVAGALAGSAVQRVGADALASSSIVLDGPTASRAPADGVAADSIEGRGGVPGAASGTEGAILVDVVGAVARPGVVRLPTGARALDAIARAGGALDGAAIDAINLARPLVDGEQLRVPTQEEVDAGAVTIADTPRGGAPGGLVSINRAGLEELETLPRIGPSLAAAIVAHREEHGAFASIADLDAVPGIGPALMATLEPLVTL